MSYAPQSLQGQQPVVPAFALRSQGLLACVNGTQDNGELVDGGCWSFFARDRSLSAPDWKIEVPLFVGEGATESAWILGDGLKADERPVIEDVVLYLRYRARPVSE